MRNKRKGYQTKNLSHPSPVGTNGRCSAIVEGKQRANQKEIVRKLLEFLA